MTKSQALQQARQQPARRSKPFTIFEVDEYDTIRQHGVPDPETNADIYPDVDPDDIRSGRDASELADRHPGFGGLVMRLIEDECDQVEASLQALPEDSPRRRKLTVLVELLTEQMDDCASWLEALPPERLQPVLDLVTRWLAEDIDWTSCEIPMDAGAQGEALSWFESMTSDVLEDLGVVIVNGEHPGSTYYAAELKGDVETANRKAEALGLDIRFVREGDLDETIGTGGDEGEDEPCDMATPPLAVDSAPPLQVDDSTEALPFEPRFGIEHASSVPADATTTHDPLPEPELRHLHLGWLFDSAWQRIVDAIRNPVEVHVDQRGHRHVHIVGGAVYTADPAGRWSGRLWLASAGRAPALADHPPGTLTLDGVPAGWIWLDRWERGFAVEVQREVGRQAGQVVRDEAERYARWAFGVFRNRIRSGCDLRTMRRRVTAALALDPLALAVARQLCLTERVPRATMALYNRVVDHLPAHRQLVNDGPGLQLSYALLCHDTEGAAPAERKGCEPLQRLKRRLVARKLSSRAWRMLLQGGTAIWRPMVRFYRPAGTWQAWDYLRLLDRLAWRGAPDPRFMQLLLAQAGSSDRQKDSYEPLFQSEARLLRSIVSRYEAQDEAGRADMEADLPAVLTWIARKEAEPLHSAKRIPTWPTLVRKARAFVDRRLRTARLSPGPWPSPSMDLAAVADSPYLVEPLLTPEALYDEGESMRHCALSYAPECIQGSAFIASVRDCESGRRIATALWTARSDEWCLTEVVGFANGQVSRRVRLLLGAVKIGNGSDSYASTSDERGP